MNFCAAQTVPNIVRELKDNTEERIFYVVAGAGTMCLAVFSSFGVFGYLTYGDAVSADLLVSYPLGTASTIGRIALIINLCCCVPLQVQPARDAISYQIYDKPAVHIAWTAFYAITLTLMGLSTLIAVTVQDFGMVISILGGFFCVSLVIILPAWFFGTIFPRRLRIVTKLYFILGCVLVPTIISLDLYLKFKKPPTTTQKPSLQYFRQSNNTMWKPVSRSSGRFCNAQKYW